MTNPNNVHPLYLLLCENTLSDQASNNITAVNIVEQINVNAHDKNEFSKILQEKGKVEVGVKLTILSAWEFDKMPNAFNLGLKITDPKGTELIDNHQVIEIGDRTKKRQRVVQGLQVFPVSTDGRYVIEETLTSGKDVSIQRTYLEVKIPSLV